MRHVNKQNTSGKKKFGLKKTRSRMINQWIGKTTKKSCPKTIKFKVKLLHVNKKLLARKKNLFKRRFLTLHDAKPLAFLLRILFRPGQNRYCNLSSKLMKICEQIFKKT